MGSPGEVGTSRWNRIGHKGRLVDLEPNGKPIPLRLTVMLLGLLLARAAQSGGRIGYRVKTGTKYHLQSCRTLRGKGIPIKLSDAKRDGRDPCKICKPGT